LPPSPEVSRPERLRVLLGAPGLLVMPCCYDALSARLVERAGFSAYDAEAARYAHED